MDDSAQLGTVERPIHRLGPPRTGTGLARVGARGGGTATRPSSIAGVGLGEIANHYERTIRGLDEPPIIMAHSFGGALVQILLARGLGVMRRGHRFSAGQGCASGPTVHAQIGLARAGQPSQQEQGSGPDPRQFHYAFTNTLSHEESQAVYDRYHVPGSARVLFQGAFGNFNPRAATRVDFRNNSRAPLLFIAGGADHVVPPKVNKANARLHRKSSAITDYHEFPDRSHYTVGQDGWEGVADFALAWAVHNSQAHA